MALMGAAFADDELLQDGMDGLSGISREELGVVLEEWLLRLYRCIQRNREYVGQCDFNKDILIVSTLFCLAIIEFSGTPCA
jgi:hypothetical protein